jgi:hypothetical protein
LAAAFRIFEGYRIGGRVRTFDTSWTQEARRSPESMFPFTAQLTMS